MPQLTNLQAAVADASSNLDDAGIGKRSFELLAGKSDNGAPQGVEVGLTEIGASSQTDLCECTRSTQTYSQFGCQCFSTVPRWF